jgi:hypothetical protein
MTQPYNPQDPFGIRDASTMTHEEDAMDISPDAALKYVNASITTIHRGKTEYRKGIVYATIKSSAGETLVTATLDYCVARMKAAAKHFP